MVPLAETTIYEMERRGEFPRRFNLTPRCVVWDLAEVEAWIEQRKQDPRTVTVKPDVRQRKTRRVRAGGCRCEGGLATRGSFIRPRRPVPFGAPVQGLVAQAKGTSSSGAASVSSRMAPTSRVNSLPPASDCTGALTRQRHMHAAARQSRGRSRPSESSTSGARARSLATKVAIDDAATPSAGLSTFSPCRIAKA